MFLIVFLIRPLDNLPDSITGKKTPELRMPLIKVVIPACAVANECFMNLHR